MLAYSARGPMPLLRHSYAHAVVLATSKVVLFEYVLRAADYTRSRAC